MRYTLEILAYAVEACAVAESAGADRIELCANPGEGGTTPSLGVIRQAIRQARIPVFPMIRPRGGDFLYEDGDFEAMRFDILQCKNLGASGVVLGLLTADGRVDRLRTAELVSLAYPMEVTFHRAFDHSLDPLQALEDIIDCGCTRLLTSGQQPRAIEGISLLETLVQKAAHRIIIMPGAGIRAGNLAAICQGTGAEEFHSSAGIRVHSKMDYQLATWSDERTTLMPDPDEVGAMKTLLRNLAKTA